MMIFVMTNSDIIAIVCLSVSHNCNKYIIISPIFNLITVLKLFTELYLNVNMIRCLLFFVNIIFGDESD